MAITKNGKVMGGARPNSGAKKGQHRIAIDKLKAALEAGLGFPYEEMLSQTQVKLFNDFKNDTNVKEYLMFTENMSKRLLQEQSQEVTIIETLSRDEVEDRINNLKSRLALTTKAEDEPNAD